MCGQHGCNQWSQISLAFCSLDSCQDCTSDLLWFCWAGLGPLDNQMQVELYYFCVREINCHCTPPTVLSTCQEPTSQKAAACSIILDSVVRTMPSQVLNWPTMDTTSNKSLTLKTFVILALLVINNNLAHPDTWHPYYWQMNKEEKALWPSCPLKHP